VKSKICNYFLIFLLAAVLIQCKSDKEEKSMTDDTKKITFGDDLGFLQKYSQVVVLQDERAQAQVIVSPRLQGKVMTSTASGLTGMSFGWINYDLISSGKIEEHMNGYGGEDRLWLGPEGGQYSIFFTPGKEMKIENWFTPKGIDIEPFALLAHTAASVEMETSMRLQNYTKTTFDVKIKRKVSLLTEAEIQSRLQISTGKEVKAVAFETGNALINNGPKAWTSESGTLCLWILGMFRPSAQATVIVPFVAGEEKDLGPIVTSDYFGEIPPDRLKIKDNCIFFKTDGNYRSKIGIAPKRAKNVAASYDPLNSVLTIIQYELPSGEQRYINQLWEIQEEPFKGDVINSYNDGPLADGSQLGSFYELESSSPAAFLKPGEMISHHHATYHFLGPEYQLDRIALKVLGVNLQTISAVFK
jgi:hypothetical protein